MALKKRKNSTPATALPKNTRTKGLAKSDKGPLTEMQRSFVHHFVNNKLNQTAAARQAGFNQPGTAANFLMKMPKILKAVEIERAESAKASGKSRSKVIDGFTEAIDMGRIKGDPIAMIAGWREIGKMCGFYEPTKTKIEVSVQGKVMVERLNSMSDEELLALAQGDPSVLEGDFSVIEDGE